MTDDDYKIFMIYWAEKIDDRLDRIERMLQVDEPDDVVTDLEGVTASRARDQGQPL